MQCVAVCCSVLQCAAVCCSVRSGSLWAGCSALWTPYMTLLTRDDDAVCCSVLQCVAVWKAALSRQVARLFWHVIYLFLTRDVALLTRCTAFLACSTALSHIMHTALLAHQTALLIRYAALLTRNTALLAHYAALLTRWIVLLICCTTFVTYLCDVFEMSRPSAIFRGKSLGTNCSSATCRCRVLQGVALRCSVLLCVVECCCRVLQGVAGCCRVLPGVAGCESKHVTELTNPCHTMSTSSTCIQKSHTHARTHTH